MKENVVAGVRVNLSPYHTESVQRYPLFPKSIWLATILNCAGFKIVAGYLEFFKASSVLDDCKCF